MKRSIFCGLLAAMLLSTPAQAAQIEQTERAERSVIVQVDGHWLDSRGVVRDGVTYVPLRSLMEAFGGWEIWWDSQKKVAVAQSKAMRLTVDPAADTISAGGHTYRGEVFIERGRTYVPVRLVATLCGGSAAWDRYLGGAAVTSPDADHDASDLYWLSRIISAESRGEAIEGQIAVGNVVLNRVAAEEFPDTIPSVIFDRKHDVQFTPVSNGTVFLTPTTQSVEAAKRTLNGENTVGKALYFYAPALSQGVWINANRTYLMTIGCHRFYL